MSMHKVHNCKKHPGKFLKIVYLSKGRQGLYCEKCKDFISIDYPEFIIKDDTLFRFYSFGIAYGTIKMSHNDKTVDLKIKGSKNPQYVEIPEKILTKLEINKSNYNAISVIDDVIPN